MVLEVINNTMRKLSKEQVQEKLLVKNIEIVGDYIGYHQRTLFRCLKDGYEWYQTPSEILGRRGCPMCSGKAKIITNKYVDNFLDGSEFKRIGEYKGCHDVMQFLCLKHNEEFSCEFNILKKRLGTGYGCNKCFYESRAKDNIHIDEKLKNTGIRRVGEYTGMNVNCEFECIEDGYRWLATPANVLTKYVNKTKPKRKLSNEEIDRRLTGRTTKRFGELLENRRCKFMCEICNHIWDTNIYDVLQGTDCPLCKYGKSEKILKNELDKLGLLIEYHKKFEFNNRKYFVDFYFPCKNLIIEYNGEQHYKPVQFGGMPKSEASIRLKKQKVRDEELRLYCKSNDIKLIEIKYNEKINEVINKIVNVLI
jgi:hypothetical protein